MSDLLDYLGALESRDDLHEARILVLLHAFAGPDGEGEIEGLTKLAKLDFFLRYPTMLERALKKKGASTKAIRVLDHERNSVESAMVRYRFGPWDHRYRRVINLLVAKDLARLHVQGRTVRIGITLSGKEAADKILDRESFEDLGRRARTLRTHLDQSGTHLMKFVYDTFPEIVSMRSNEVIKP